MSAADIFTIGSSGLRTYRTQLATISQNISNAGSANYSRRTTTIGESRVSGTNEILYLPRANFGGSEAYGISRASDPYLDANVRNTGSALANANTRLRWMNDIEIALSDDELGVGTSLTNFYSSIDQLAANPADTSLRTNVLYRLDQIVSAFHTSSDGLETVLDGTYNSAQSSVSLLNTYMSQLQEINRSLLRSDEGTANRAQLLDNRDAALQKIGNTLNITISFGTHEEAMVSYNGQTIVSPALTQASSFAVSQNADGTLALSLDGSATAIPTGGTLGGDFTSAATARTRLDSLDALAVQFAADINAWHRQGYTDAGVTNVDMLSVGTTAASLTSVLGGISNIAAASADGTINGNLVAISAARQASDVESQWTELVTTHGNLVSTTTSEQAAAETRDENARSAREEVSGVDLDMEAADLMRVQQAYQACARIIQAARDITDTMLKIN